MTRWRLVTATLLISGCSAPNTGDDGAGGSDEASSSAGPTTADATSTMDGDASASASASSTGMVADSSSEAGSQTDSSSDDGGPSGPFDPSCPEPDLENLPGWVPDAGTWGTISLNTIWDLNPCDDDPNCSWSANLGLSALIDVWNGGVFACHEGELGSLVYWGGGHNGYWGNEVYVYDLASQLWQRRTDPNPNPVVADPANGELDDGTPSVMHTYELLTYHPGTNSMAVLQGQSVHNVASNNDAGHLFSLTDNAWRRTALLPGGSGYGSSAYDVERELIWGVAQFGNVFSYDPVGGPDADGRFGVATMQHDVSISLDTVAAIDPNNDVFVILDLRETPRALAQDLANPTQPLVELTTSGPMPASGAGGFEWVNSAQRFYWYAGSGDELRTLTPPAAGGDWRTEPWVWDTVTPTSGNGPEPRGNGVYGGWRWARAIQSFVICNDVQDAVYAFRPS